jgi:hypothetical protein
MAAEYAQRRLAEAEQRRLLQALKPVCASRPAWCPLLLALAHGLIALGQRLQAAAEPQPQAQPAYETRC